MPKQPGNLELTGGFTWLLRWVKNQSLKQVNIQKHGCSAHDANQVNNIGGQQRKAP